MEKILWKDLREDIKKLEYKFEQKNKQVKYLYGEIKYRDKRIKYGLHSAKHYKI